MRPTPDALMLFAAGFGTRMGALTAHQPKPLVKVAGRSLIDHALSLADAAGVTRKVANTHYLADQIAAHLAHRPDIALSHETPCILDTGGGLKKALPLLGKGPVFTLNTDAVWTGANPLTQLHAAWRPADMDVLLLLLPVQNATGHGGKSDFLLESGGRISWARGAPGHVYLGAQIIVTDGLDQIDEAAFPIYPLWEAALAKGRAYGLVHQGGWCDVGHPGGIAEAEAMLQAAHVQ